MLRQKYRLLFCNLFAVKFCVTTMSCVFFVRGFGHALFNLRANNMDFEKAFSDFIDGKEYDEAQSTLFFITREAFKAGWKAALSSPTPNDKIIELNKTEAER